MTCSCEPVPLPRQQNPWGGFTREEMEMSGDASMTVRAAAVKQRLIGLLRSSPVQNIDFFLGIMHVNGAGYSRVADAVANGSIKVRLGNVPAGAAAAFRTSEMTFNFPDRSYGCRPSDEEDIVH